MSWLSKAFKSVKSFILPAAAVVAAPFTGGASLSFLPAAVGAQGVINTAVAGAENAEAQKRAEEEAKRVNDANIAAQNAAVAAQTKVAEAQAAAITASATAAPVSSPAAQIIARTAEPVFYRNEGVGGFPSVQYLPAPEKDKTQNFALIAIAIIGLFLVLRKA